MTGEYAAVGLFQPKDPHNVGSVLRAAGCFGVALVAVQGKRYSRAPTDPQKAYRSIPLIHFDDLRWAVPFDCVPVAVELIEGARDLTTYTHPPRAFYVFGPEDGALGKAVLSWCKDVVRIPSVVCLNLAASVNVVLYDRVAKLLRAQRRIA